DGWTHATDERCGLVAEASRLREVAASEVRQREQTVAENPGPRLRLEFAPQYRPCLLEERHGGLDPTDRKIVSRNAIEAPGLVLRVAVMPSEGEDLERPGPIEREVTGAEIHVREDREHHALLVGIVMRFCEVEGGQSGAPSLVPTPGSRAPGSL